MMLVEAGSREKSTDHCDLSRINFMVLGNPISRHLSQITRPSERIAVCMPFVTPWWPIGNHGRLCLECEETFGLGVM